MIIFVGIILFAAFYIYENGGASHFASSLSLRATRDKKILFVGDMNFDRYIRQVGNIKGEDFIFSCKDSNGTSLSDFLQSFDLVVGNLEGPITDNPSISMGSAVESPENYTFTFPPSTAKLLAKNNIKLVNSGNNHIGNFGQEGIASTKKYLTESGVDYIYNNSIFSKELGGNKISFISYNEFAGESVEKVAQKIYEEKNNGQIVFVYAHWGGEYSEVPSRVKNTAELFAKSGADLIIGSHSHIILPSEKINNTLVYYSLGNFIFDQYWNKEVSTGLVLEVNIKDDHIKIIEHKVSLNRDGRTCLIN